MFQEFFGKRKVALFLGSCLGPVRMEITIFKTFHGAPSEILALGAPSESLHRDQNFCLQKTMVPDQTLPAHARAEMCMQPIVFLIHKLLRS